VAAGTSYATDVGVRVLEDGGNAVDAAVAAAFALAVADPADSGLGGISLALIRLADGRAVAIDGASTTPAAFDLDHMMMLEEERRSYSAIESTAVPTSLPVLADMARRYGTRPLGELIQPAIDIAESGYVQSFFQITTIWRNIRGIREDDYLAGMVLRNGTDLPKESDRFYRRDLAKTLRLIRDRGPQEFSVGTVAAAYEADVARRGGWVTRQDLSMVRAREQIPDTTEYRGYQIVAFPSPGSGASVVEAMNLLETLPTELLREHSVDRMQMVTDVFRIVLADQQSMIPDPNVHQALRDRTFATEEFTRDRSERLELGEALTTDNAPQVAGRCRPQPDDDGQTTQISVIDRWGNAVSMTSSLGNFYGAQKAVPGYGIIHNNLLSGSCPQGPRWAFVSDMAPTIVVKDGKPFLVLGSAGSARISTVIAFVISNMIDRGMSLAEAIEAPRTLWRGTTSSGAMIEILPPITMADVEALMERGHEEPRLITFPTKLNYLVTAGAVNAAHLDPETGIMTSVGDPRRNGRAMGAER
jgi:gamma-glutamyltranspeptidase/glutathione hydrolase